MQELRFFGNALQNFTDEADEEPRVTRMALMHFPRNPIRAIREIVVNIFFILSVTAFRRGPNVSSFPSAPQQLRSDVSPALFSSGNCLNLAFERRLNGVKPPLLSFLRTALCI